MITSTRFNLSMLLLTFLTMTAISCDQADTQPPAGTQAASASGKVVMDFPDSWEISRDQGEVALMGVAVPDNTESPINHNINVILEPLPQKISLARYTELTKYHLQDGLVNPKIVSAETVKLAGYEAERIVYLHDYESMTFKALLYLIVKDQTAYVITCTSNPENYERHEPIFEEIVATFRLE